MKNLTVRQKQIIDITIKIISEKGIQDLTMKNLSGKLGISEPAIYRHFESKQKILVAVLESFKHQNSLINDNTKIEGETSFEHLCGSINLIMIRFKNNPAMSAVIFSEENFQNQNELSEMVKNIMNSTIEYFNTLIEMGQRDNSIRSDMGKEELTIIVMGSLRHIVTLWRLSGFSTDLEGSGLQLGKTLQTLLAI